MARAKVVHSTDACTIIFRGDKANAEPSTGVIKFPGGLVEVSRTSDGKYWAHICVDEASNVVGSRVDCTYEKWVETGGEIPPIPHEGHIKKIAVKVDGPFLSDD